MHTSKHRSWAVYQGGPFISSWSSAILQLLICACCWRRSQAKKLNWVGSETTETQRGWVHTRSYVVIGNDRSIHSCDCKATVKSHANKFNLIHMNNWLSGLFFPALVSMTATDRSDSTVWCQSVTMAYLLQSASYQQHAIIHKHTVESKSICYHSPRHDGSTVFTHTIHSVTPDSSMSSPKWGLVRGKRSETMRAKKGRPKSNTQFWTVRISHSLKWKVLCCWDGMTVSLQKHSTITTQASQSRQL